MSHICNEEEHGEGKKYNSSMIEKIKDQPGLAVGPSKSCWTRLLKKD